jgi:hypothetical protein
LSIAETRVYSRAISSTEASDLHDSLILGRAFFE